MYYIYNYIYIYPINVPFMDTSATDSTDLHKHSWRLRNRQRHLSGDMGLRILSERGLSRKKEDHGPSIDGKNPYKYLVNICKYEKTSGKIW